MALKGTPGTFFFPFIELQKEAESSPKERTLRFPIACIVSRTQPFPFFFFCLSFFSSRAPTTAARQRKRKRKKGRSLVCFMSLTPQPVESCDRQCNFGWHGEVGDRQGNYSVQNLTNYRQPSESAKSRCLGAWCTLVHDASYCMVPLAALHCTCTDANLRCLEQYWRTGSATVP